MSARSRDDDLESVIRACPRWKGLSLLNTFHRRPFAETYTPIFAPAKMAQRRPVVLVVIDGFGYRKASEGNAARLARMPTWQSLWARSPRTLLEASSLAVGLPEGQMGNSEVGHLNLGAGRVVKQDLVRIGEAVRDGSFFSKPAFVDQCARVRADGGTLH